MRWDLQKLALRARGERDSFDVAHSQFVHGMEERLEVHDFEPDGDVLRFRMLGRTTVMTAELHGLGSAGVLEER